jgi:O-antigen/teichoic acid export membrane protein
MGPEEMGRVTQVMSVAALASAMLVGPVLAYFGRGLLGWIDAGRLLAKLQCFFAYVVVIGGLSSAVVWLVQGRTGLVSGISTDWVALLVLLYVLAYSFHTVATSCLNILGRRGVYVIFANLAVWGGLGLALIMFSCMRKPQVWLLGIYSGFVLSATSIVLLIRIGFQAKAQPREDGSHCLAFTVKTVSVFAWPQAVAHGFYWLLAQSYRFILGSRVGVTSVGLFAAAYMVCSVPMQTFETLFNEFYSPTLYRSIKNRATAEEMARAWNAYASAYVPAVILFGAFLAGSCAFLVKLLLGEEFQVAAPILICPILTETMRAISSSLHTMGIVTVDMRINLPPVAAGAIISPILVYILAPWNPLIGTGLALFASYIVVILIVIPMTYRTLPIRWPVARMLSATILGLPMIVLGYVARESIPDLTFKAAAVGLLITGLYLAMVQYAMARPWFQHATTEAQAC